MANYKNSLGESELFGRMTAGFAKICESVQSGKFVRDEMGVICESVCEASEKKEVFTVHGDNVSQDEGEDDMKYCGPIYYTEKDAIKAAKAAAVEYADDDDVIVFTVFGGEYEKPNGDITGEGDVDLFSISNKDKEATTKAREAAGYANPGGVYAYVVNGKVVTEDVDADGVSPDDGAIADAGTTDAGTEGATQDADVASATPEQINGSVNEGEKLTRGAVDAVVKSGSDNALTNSGDAPDGWTVLDAEGKTVVDFGTLDDVVAGAIEKGVEFDVDEDMLPKFRKWYDALEEAKVVGEGIVGKTLGTIGGATVGSAIGGALGCPVAGGIAGGIAGASLTEGCDGKKKKKPMKKLIPEGCCGGKAKKVLKETDNEFHWIKCSGCGANLCKETDSYRFGPDGEPVCYDCFNGGYGEADGKKTKKFLKECGSKVVTEKKVPLCKTCGNPLDETGTCQDCQGYSEVKEGEGEIKLQIPAELKRKAALKANAKANKEKVAKAIRDGKAVGIVKEGIDDRKGADKITKDVVFGMLVNLLYQLRDGASVEEVTANPDMEEFDDYTLDEVLELAKKYEV